MNECLDGLVGSYMKQKNSIPTSTQMNSWNLRIWPVGVQSGSSEDFHTTSLVPLQPGPEQNMPPSSAGRLGAPLKDSPVLPAGAQHP